MLRIELRIRFRRIDPVCKLGQSGSPAETLEAVANTPQPSGARRCSRTHMVHCRLSHAIINQVIAPAASTAEVAFKASIVGPTGESPTSIVLVLVYGHQSKLIPPHVDLNRAECPIAVCPADHRVVATLCGGAYVFEMLIWEALIA